MNVVSRGRKRVVNPPMSWDTDQLSNHLPTRNVRLAGKRKFFSPFLSPLYDGLAVLYIIHLGSSSALFQVVYGCVLYFFHSYFQSMYVGVIGAYNPVSDFFF